jgi:uncharacterized protein (TIGR02001 family)
MSPRNGFRAGARLRTWPWPVACALLLAAAPPLRAASPWSATITGTTDYIYRGSSRTDERPALQAGFNYQSPIGAFAGAWGSGVNPYPYNRHAVEFDLYAGWGWQLSPRWSARTAYTRTLYAWDHRRQAYDYGEFSVSLGFEDRLAATVSFQPDSTQATTYTYARNKHATSYELSGTLPLPRAWRLPAQPTLLASAGYYDQSQLFHANYWAGAAGLRLTQGRLQFELLRFFADPKVGSLYGDSTANGRWAGSLSVRF